MFQNHSCDPNCCIVAAYVNETDLRKPFLAVFTKKRVRAGDELTFHYAGDADDEMDEKVFLERFTNMPSSELSSIAT
jgi:SET domain-containing protein